MMVMAMVNHHHHHHCLMSNRDSRASFCVSRIESRCLMITCCERGDFSRCDFTIKIYSKIETLIPSPFLLLSHTIPCLTQTFLAARPGTTPHFSLSLAFSLAFYNDDRSSMPRPSPRLSSWLLLARLAHSLCIDYLISSQILVV